jgi:hypothetical protein
LWAFGAETTALCTLRLHVMIRFWDAFSAGREYRRRMFSTQLRIRFCGTFLWKCLHRQRKIAYRNAVHVKYLSLYNFPDSPHIKSFTPRKFSWVLKKKFFCTQEFFREYSRKSSSVLKKIFLTVQEYFLDRTRISSYPYKIFFLCGQDFFLVRANG